MWRSQWVSLWVCESVCLSLLFIHMAVQSSCLSVCFVSICLCSSRTHILAKQQQREKFFPLPRRDRKASSFIRMDEDGSGFFLINKEFGKLLLLLLLLWAMFSKLLLVSNSLLIVIDANSSDRDDQVCKPNSHYCNWAFYRVKLIVKISRQ